MWLPENTFIERLKVYTYPHLARLFGTTTMPVHQSGGSVDFGDLVSLSIEEVSARCRVQIESTARHLLRA